MMTSDWCRANIAWMDLHYKTIVDWLYLKTAF